MWANAPVVVTRRIPVSLPPLVVPEPVELMLTGPVNVSLPDNTNVPVPFLVNPPLPVMLPLNVLVPFWAPMVSVPLPRLSVPAPLN